MLSTLRETRTKKMNKARWKQAIVEQKKKRVEESRTKMNKARCKRASVEKSQRDTDEEDKQSEMQTGKCLAEKKASQRVKDEDEQSEVQTGNWWAHSERHGRRRWTKRGANKQVWRKVRQTRSKEMNKARCKRESVEQKEGESKSQGQRWTKRGANG